MNIGSRSRLRQLQLEHSDQLLSVLTVLLLVMLFVVAPFQAVGIKIFDAFGVVVGMVMIAGVLIISASLAATAIILVGFSLNIIVVTARLIQPLPYDLYLSASGWFIIVCTLGYVVARKVFSGGEVTFHRIVGAVLLYLLIALAFVSAFLLLGFWLPNAFSGLVVEDNQKLSSSLIYFSFVTLTTVGYGDIVPVHPVARSLCNLESIIGQLYPATLLARMVSLEIEARRR
jgi:hypothetical protein